MPQPYPRGARFPDPVVFGAVPGGLYRVTLPLFVEGRTKAEDKLKYDSSTGLHIEAVERITDQRSLAEKWGGDPDALIGMSIFTPNDFIIGLLDQPGPVDAGGQLADPDDWLKTGQGRGGPLFNNMIEASGIDATDDADENCALMEGRQVLVQVRVEKDETGTYPDKNRIVKFFPVKEASKPAPVARPAPAAARPAAVAPRPAPTPARPVAPAARPVAPAARPAAPSRVAAPARATEPAVVCDVCESEGKGSIEVPRSGFAKHLREEHPES
jgi:hypothetical protein